MCKNYIIKGVVEDHSDFITAVRYLKNTYGTESVVIAAIDANDNLGFYKVEIFFKDVSDALDLTEIRKHLRKGFTMVDITANEVYLYPEES